jgi:uncharacterized protein (DUF1499 family)
VIAAFALATFGMGWYSHRVAPPALDQGCLPACPKSPNCVLSTATDQEHQIEPIRFTGTAEAAMRRLGQVISGVAGMRIVEQTPTYIRAEAETPILRFVDDVQFLLDEQAGVIQVRSASRIGYSDLGVNRRRIELIRARLSSTP